MAIPKLPSKRRFVKASTCIPLFLLGCVAINVILIGLWLVNGTHQPIPHGGSPATASMSHLDPTVDVDEDVPMPVPPGLASSSLTTPSQGQAAPHAVDASFETPPVIAHVVSLIKCKKSSSVTGFLDAAAVLRHSIHKQSIHAKVSKYSYQMYAIVHKDGCSENAALLQNLGYKTLVRDTPVQLDEIQGEWYRNHVENENCCGSKEFIKLYAYELEDHPIVVHWDMDVAILKPMDDLYDAMLFPKDSPEGRAARSRLQVQHPSRVLPDVIDAFMTRDITSSQPWEKVQGVQGGFLVNRPSKVDLETYVKFIKEGNYSSGRCATCGWAGLGYGGFQGAMAYQGAVAYFYDIFKPNTAVELNVCKWNQVVADVIWRGPDRMEHHMQCREYPLDGNFEANTQCEDCRITPIEEVNTVHYTACKKPWECTIPHPRQTNNEKQKYRLSHLTNITTCGMLFSKWFELRQDFEDLLEKRTGVKPSQRDGNFEKDYFKGNCANPGRYIPMIPPPEGFDVKKLYGV